MRRIAGRPRKEASVEGALRPSGGSRPKLTLSVIQSTSGSRPLASAGGLRGRSPLESQWMIGSSRYYIIAESSAIVPTRRLRS